MGATKQSMLDDLYRNAVVVVQPDEIYFWTGSQWSREYPEAKKFSLNEAYAAIATNKLYKVGAETRVVVDYGHEDEEWVARAEQQSGVAQAQRRMTKAPKNRSALDDVMALMAKAGALGPQLDAALRVYETTGDHDHGKGPIAPGRTCPGGDCWVTYARRTLELLSKLDWKGRVQS